MQSDSARSAGELRTYLAVVARRKWIILPLLVLTPLVAYYISNSGTKKYSASAQVLLNRQSQGIASNNLNDPTLLDPQRLVSTQTIVASSPAIAQAAIQSAGVTSRGAGGFSVSGDQNSDVLTFHVRDTNPNLAATLANAYAESYIAYRRKHDTATLAKASAEIQRQVSQLSRRGLTGSQAYGSLIQTLEQLRTAETLAGSNVQLLRAAKGAGQVEPRPKRFALIGLAIGLVIGFGAAFLVESLDTRVRSTDEIAESTGLPLLGRLPPPSASFRRRNRLAMLDHPVSPQAEPFRILRANLQFTNLEHGCRSIMITSALHSEGKSTTAGNLAVALARAGLRVMLVDLDLRRPSLHRFFDLGHRPGMTDVLLGHATIDDAVTQLTFSSSSENGGVSRLSQSRAKALGARRAAAVGTLEVIGAGSIPPNPGEFIATAALDEALEQMTGRADLLLVDGPPMLLAGDALTLSAKIDGLIIVARLNAFDRDAIDELGRFLAASPSEKLGLVVTDDGWNRGYGYYYSQPKPKPTRQERRASSRSRR